MRKYFSCPKAWAGDEIDYWAQSDRVTIDVFVSDVDPVDTGLVDSSGVPIMAVETREQAAFVRHDDGGQIVPRETVATVTRSIR